MPPGSANICMLGRDALALDAYFRPRFCATVCAILFDQRFGIADHPGVSHASAASAAVPIKPARPPP
jgi:hypothetical protein